MHDWFAAPIATHRMGVTQQRATVHRLRVARGRDLTARLSWPLLGVADRSAARLQLRRRAAAAGAAPACC